MNLEKKYFCFKYITHTGYIYNTHMLYSLFLLWLNVVKYPNIKTCGLFHKAFAALRWCGVVRRRADTVLVTIREYIWVS